MSINTERMELGIAALESGEYKKGKGYLHQVDNAGNSLFCCLGVLTLVAIANGLEISRRWVEGDSWDPRHEIFSDEDGLEDYGGLCWAVAGWYGLGDLDPELITPSGDRREASLWNDCGPLPDSAGVPEEDFTEIAAGFRRTFLEKM